MTIHLEQTALALQSRSILLVFVCIFSPMNDWFSIFKAAGFNVAMGGSSYCARSSISSLIIVVNVVVSSTVCSRLSKIRVFHRWFQGSGQKKQSQ